MSLPRKGSRRIVVDGVTYRWRIRQRPTYSQAALDHTLTLAVERESEKSSVLIVDLARAHPANWLGDPTTPVTPKEVAQRIREAISSGWRPADCEGAFRYKGASNE